MPNIINLMKNEDKQALTYLVQSRRGARRRGFSHPKYKKYMLTFSKPLKFVP